MFNTVHTTRIIRMNADNFEKKTCQDDRKQN